MEGVCNFRVRDWGRLLNVEQGEGNGLGCQFGLWWVCSKSGLKLGLLVLKRCTFGLLTMKPQGQFL